MLENEVNKVQLENNRRLDTLYRESHNWLCAVAFNFCKDKEVADELVGTLYLYLAEKCNPSLWYLNSFNLMYAHSFLKSRFLNKIKADNIPKNTRRNLSFIVNVKPVFPSNLSS